MSSFFTYCAERFGVKERCSVHRQRESLEQIAAGVKTRADTRIFRRSSDIVRRRSKVTVLLSPVMIGLLRHPINTGAERFAQKGAESRILIGSTHHAANGVFQGEPSQR